MKVIKSLETVSNASNNCKKPLTPAEAKELTQCEQIIHKGLTTFVEVGEALIKIRDLNLHRNTHDTFEEYCREKWKFTARQANRLMLASSVVTNLESDQLVRCETVAIPANEAQARPLATLTPPQQVKAAKLVAAKTDEPTTKDFEKAAEEVADPEPKVKAVTPKPTKLSSYKPSMEALVELIDEVQTMVRVGKPKEAVLAKLKQAADLATRINNGGAKC